MQAHRKPANRRMSSHNHQQRHVERAVGEDDVVTCGSQSKMKVKEAINTQV